MRQRTNGGCLVAAFVWFMGNAIFGLAPLLFLVTVNPALEKHEASTEIETLLKGGIILFVCCALMGAVIIEILLSKIVFRRLAFFTVNVSPFILLLIICLIYLLTILGHINKTIFTTPSKFYIFVIVFTTIYCTLGKYLLYQHDANPRQWQSS